MRPRFDPSWLDSQYDNRARVKDHVAVLTNWSDASALVRSRSKAELDVPYGGGKGETLDIFLPESAERHPQPEAPAAPAAQEELQGPPESAGPAASGNADMPAGGAPILVFIHGGYWRALDKSDHSFLAPAFNAEGAIVVVPNYALCPAVTVEHIVLQTASMLAWVWRHAARLGGDPARLTAVGHSAGGHLAAMLLSCRWQDVDADMPARPLSGAMAISGLYDLEPLRHTPSLQADLRLTPTAVSRLSPAFFPRPKGARLFAVVGLDESDEFLRQNRLIRDVWGPSTVPVCETVPGANHFTVLNGLADPASRQHQLALRLLGLR